MKISSKSILSPGRTDKYREPSSSLQSSLSRRLRSNGSIRAGQYSPMFPAGSKKKGCSFETPEPSSPKVTCIGQVRVKTMKQGKKIKSRRRRGDVSFRKTEQAIESQQPQQQQECLPTRNQRWVHLPLSICEALRAFGSEFNCFLPCGGKSSCASNGGIEREKGEKRANSSCVAVFARWLMALQESKVEKRTEIEEEMRYVALVCEDQGRGKGVEELVVEEKEGDEGEEIDERKVEIQEEEDVGTCIPPRNALLLMRCRSEPFRISSFANRFWDSPARKEDEEEEDDEGEEEEDEQEEAFEELAEVKEEEEEHKEEEGLDTVFSAQALVVEEPEVPQKEEEKEQLDEVQYKEEEELGGGEEELVGKLFEEELKNLLQEEEEDEKAEEEAIQLQQSREEQTQLQQIEEEEEEEEKEVIFSEDKEMGLVHTEEEQEQEQRRSSSVSTATVHLKEEAARILTVAEAEEAEEKEEIKSATVAVAVAAVEQKKEEEHENQNPLPECLLMMMYEPKLSMEVLKETWVCRSDFLKLRPEKAGNNAEVMAKEKEKQREEEGEEARRVSTGSNPVYPLTTNPTPPPLPDLTQNPPSMAMVIEQKLVNAVAYEPFVLTRCKSEPMRSSAKLVQEACFWKSRKLQPYRPPVGEAGVGF